MLIAIFDSRIDPALADRLPGHDFKFFDSRPSTASTFIERAQGAQVIGVQRIHGFQFDRAVVSQLPDFQFMHKFPGTGMDWLDMPAFNDHGILVATNVGVNAPSVADHIMLLTQLCLRGTFEKLTQMRNGIVTRDPPSHGVLGIEGKTVGIIGLGQIGTHAARRFAVSGAKIAAHGRHPREEPTIPGGVTWLSLDDLLKTSDVVVPCVPLSPETEHLIGARELALMKPTAVLINCSRGRILDEVALYEALAARRIRAAGLDVFAPDPTPSDNPLLALDNLFATPHVAGSAADQEAGLIENLELYTTGRRPRRLANPQILDLGTSRTGPLQPS